MIFSVCKTSSCFPVSLNLVSSIGIELIFMPSVAFCLSLRQYKQYAWMNTPSRCVSKVDVPHQSFLSPTKRRLSCEEVFFLVSSSFTTILFGCMKKKNPYIFGVNLLTLSTQFFSPNRTKPKQTSWRSKVFSSDVLTHWQLFTFIYGPAVLRGLQYWFVTLHAEWVPGTAVVHRPAGPSENPRVQI